MNGGADSFTRAQTPLSEPAAKPLRQLSGYIQPHKTVPPNWPNYLPDLVGLFARSPEDVFMSMSLGGAFSVEVTTETRTSNLIRHQRHRRPALSAVVTSCLDHFQ